ncbi:hypothetical protein Pfo_027383 [Paulownia fortunei]|nr:hypothetical protein Pfo_027383 [Paulownia fortunei]
MKSLSGVGLGLSLVFGFLLLALIAELYYLLWWKKRYIGKRSNEEDGSHIQQERAEFFYIFFCCWKKPTSSLRSTAQELCSSATLVHEPQSSSNSNKDLWLKPFGEENMDNFPGLPRFLFTITEETREDLESEDGIIRNRKQSTSRSNLSDLLQILETPFLTPLGSPPYFTPPLTPSLTTDHQQNFGPFFESERDAAFNRLRSSPPPKFKFLRDAEEKLIHRRKIMEQTENGVLKNDNPSASLFHKDEENGPFISLTVAENQQDKEEEEGICLHNHSNNLEQEYFSSSSSQVLPLVSSLPTIKSLLEQQAHKPEIRLNGC